MSSFLVNVEGPLMTDGAAPPARRTPPRRRPSARRALPDLFGGLYRRHFEPPSSEAAPPRTDKVFGTFHLTVGFCDLVGYTPVVPRRSSAADLGAAVNAFEQEAHDLITTAGGRLIKSVGDAVLFSTPTPRWRRPSPSTSPTSSPTHPELTSLRSGLATGEVLGRDGDYYGSVVNLAARMVKETAPGTVVSDRPVDGFTSRSIGVAELRGVAGPDRAVRDRPAVMTVSA